ncbi:unnamed protein product, partial [Mesorhabditis spiculigera]
MKPLTWSYFLALIPVAISACKNADYTQLVSGKCYKLYPDFTKFDEAQQRCVAEGTRLAEILGYEENQALGTWLKGQQAEDAWIGLKSDVNKVLEWTDGFRANYTNIGDPNSVQAGQCFVIDGDGKYYWEGTHCDKYSTLPLCEEMAQEELTCGDYDETEGHCYKVHNERLKFWDAEDVCQREGGHLPSIHNLMENYMIFNELQLGGQQQTLAWVGLNLNFSMRWTDGTAFDYNNIANINITQDERCYAMSLVSFLAQKQWVAEECGTSFSFVCQRPKSVNPVTSAPPTLPPSQCNPNEFHGAAGAIFSPNYPNHFDGADCYLQIYGSSAAVNLDVPKISATNDWSISLYAGEKADESRLIHRIFDQIEALQYSSPVSTMLIHFQSQSPNFGSHFRMDWTSTQTPLYSLGNLSWTGSTYPPNNHKCEQHWIYDDVRDICIGITNGAKYDYSQAVCTQNGANLLSVHSQAEEENILGILNNDYYPNGYQLWLGAQYSGGAWRWADGTNLVFTDFIDGDSSNRYGNCLTVQYNYATGKRGWKGVDCTMVVPGICYKRPN